MSGSRQMIPFACASLVDGGDAQPKSRSYILSALAAVLDFAHYLGREYLRPRVGRSFNGKMLPAFARAYSGYRVYADSILGRQINGAGTADRYRFSVLFANLVLVVSCAVQAAALPHHVAAIVTHGAQKEMVRVDAHRYVAPMANKHPFGGSNSSGKFPGEAMCPERTGRAAILERGFPVAVLAFRSSPYPASRFGFAEATPEPVYLFGGDSHVYLPTIGATHV